MIQTGQLLSHISVLKGFVWRVVLPICLGVYLALWATQGETAGSDALIISAVPRVEDSYSFVNGFVTVELRFADSSAVTIMGSSQIPLMKTLVAHNKERLDIEIRPRVLQKIER
jgi:hypothetical protein